jgi:hypothetical protein
VTKVGNISGWINAETLQDDKKRDPLGVMHAKEKSAKDAQGDRKAVILEERMK